MSQQSASERIISEILPASLIAGLIAGICARIIMRIVALIAHQPPGFSIDGTLRIVGIAFILGMVAGFIYAPTVVVLNASPRFKKYLPGPVWRGLIFGLLLLALCILLSMVTPLLPPEDVALGIPVLNKFMFAALPLIFGITLGGAEKWLDHILPVKAAFSEGELKLPMD